MNHSFNFIFSTTSLSATETFPVKYSSDLFLVDNTGVEVKVTKDLSSMLLRGKSIKRGTCILLLSLF